MATIKGRAKVAAVLLVTATLVVFAAESAAQVPLKLDARVEIVWPHNGADVLSADKANVTVYAFYQGTKNLYCGDRLGFDPRLWVAKNNETGTHLQGKAERRRVSRDGFSFYVWDFNDVDVSFARDPKNRLYLTVRNLPGPPTAGETHSNVWAHATDGRTFYPVAKVPTGTYPAPWPGMARLAPEIQIVWPHDRQGREVPVNQADLVNITVTIFHRADLASFSVPPDYDWAVELYQGLNQEPLRPVRLGQKRLVTTSEGVTYPVWDFNDVDVSAAKDPRNRYFFRVTTPGDEGSNIWVHGTDGRTYFPRMDVPERGCP